MTSHFIVYFKRKGKDEGEKIIGNCQLKYFVSLTNTTAKALYYLKEKISAKNIVE